MKVFIKRKTGSIVPHKAHETDAAYDLYTSETVYIDANARTVLPLGFSMKIVDDRPRVVKFLERILRGKFTYQAQIEPRSGFSSKGVLGCAASGEEGRFDGDAKIGKVDFGYRGDVGVIFRNHGNGFYIPKGTKIAQMTIQRVEVVEWVEVSELDDTDRGNSGFGGSGNAL